MAKKAYTVRLEEPMARKIEETAEVQNLSTSDVLRHVIREGIEQERIKGIDQEIDSMSAQLDRIENEVSGSLLDSILP